MLDGTRRKMSLWLGGAALAASVGAGALVALPAGAQETPAAPEAATPGGDTPADTPVVVDDATCQAIFDQLAPPEDLPPEMVAELNAEADQLGAALSEAGVAFEMVTDEQGVKWPQFDEGDDAAWKVVDDFYAEQYGTDVVAPEDLPPELVAELNAEADRLGAALSEAGVAFEMVTDEQGVKWPQFDEGDDAAWKVVDDFYAEQYGSDAVLVDPSGEIAPGVTAEQLDACDQLWADDLGADWQPTADEIDQMKADAADFRAMLDEAGVEYTMVTDDLGIAWPEFDDSDTAAMAKLTEVMMTSVLTEDLSPEDVAWINEDAAGLAAAFDEAGVAYEWQEGDNGVRIPVWDFADESAMQVLDTYMMEDFADEPAIEDGDVPPPAPGDVEVPGAAPVG